MKVKVKVKNVAYLGGSKNALEFVSKDNYPCPLIFQKTNLTIKKKLNANYLR